MSKPDELAECKHGNKFPTTACECITEYERGKLEEREALKKKIEDLDYRGPAGFGYVSREEVLNALSTLNNEK